MAAPVPESDTAVAAAQILAVGTMVDSDNKSAAVVHNLVAEVVLDEPLAAAELG